MSIADHSTRTGGTDTPRTADTATGLVSGTRAPPLLLDDGTRRTRPPTTPLITSTSGSATGVYRPSVALPPPTASETRLPTLASLYNMTALELKEENERLIGVLTAAQSEVAALRRSMLELNEKLAWREQLLNYTTAGEARCVVMSRRAARGTG